MSRLLILLSVLLISIASCTQDCAEPTPEYCQLIKYDPEYFEPVCGCDGNTYNNNLVAECEFGILDHTPGACK